MWRWRQNIIEAAYFALRALDSESAVTFPLPFAHSTFVICAIRSDDAFRLKRIRRNRRLAEIRRMEAINERGHL